jgi:hypothetical protein
MKLPIVNKTILLVWGYERESWVRPLEVLRNEFQLVYLRYIHRSEEEASFTKEKKIYWSDFENAQQIITEVKPAKVVFMSIYNGLDIALNTVCKRYNIPTFILQHGLFTSYEDYRKRELDYKRKGVGESANLALSSAKETFSTFSFIKKSLTTRGVNNGLEIANILLPAKKRKQSVCRT